MGIFKCGILYNIRKYINTGVMVAVITLVFFCELIGLCLYSVSEQGKREAFVYHGKALSVSGVAVNPEIIAQMEATAHVTGVDRYTWYEAEPVHAHSAKDYEGDMKLETEKYSDEMCLVTHRDVQLDSWFRSEKSVSLCEGEYPTQGNKGILIEKHFAQDNNLAIGSSISFCVIMDGKEKKCDFSICGIYEVDTPFVVYSTKEMGDRLFAYSPYNRVYANCEYVAAQLGEDIYKESSWGIYTDSHAAVPEVIGKLREILGEQAEIYNDSDSYLESSTGIVVIMNNLSKMILVYTTIIGAIVLLIIITFFYEQYRQETGILTAMGYGKGKIAMMYLWNMSIKLIAGLVLAAGLYFASSDYFVEVVDSHVVETFEETINVGSGPYETPDLENGFSLDINAYRIFHSKSITWLVVLISGCLLLCTAIPFFAIWKVKAGILLEE